ncbi:MAG: tape measure protein [Polyangiaceae bacterium]
MSAVDFIVRLIDQVTGPASKMVNSLKQLDAVAKASKGAANMHMPDVAPAMSSISKMQGGWRGATQGMTSSLDSFFGDISSKFGSMGQSGASNGSAASAALLGVAAAAGTALAAVGALANGAASLTKFAIGAAGFKGDTLLALKYIMGSKEAAKESYKLIQTMGDISPFDDKQVVGMFKNLKGAGFGVQDTSQLMAALSDLSLTTSNEGVNGVAAALGKMKGKNKLSSEEINMITENSGGAVNMVQALQQVTGKKAGEVQKMIEAGKVTAEMGQAAFYKAIQNTFYQGDPNAVIGQAAAEKSKTLGGALSTLESRYQRLFEDVNIQPLADAINVLNDALATPAAMELKAAIEGMFGAFFGGASGMKGADLEAIFSKISVAVRAITPAISAIAGIFWSTVVPVAKVFASAFGTAFSAAMTPISKLFSALGGGASSINWVKVLSAAFKVVGTVVGVLAAVLLTVIGIIVAMVGIAATIWSVFLAGLSVVIDGVVSLGEEIFGEIVSWATDMVVIGSEIINGLLDGIESGAGAVVARMTELGGSVKGAVKSALGIASPSKVMLELGAYTAQGFEQGINRGAPRVNDAMNNMAQPQVDPAIRAGVLSAGARGAQGSTPGGSSQYTITINAQGGDAGSTASAIRLELSKLFVDINAQEVPA